MAIQLLAGKRGVIFGALDDQSLAWKIADVCHQMGAKFTLTNAPVALRMGALQELAAGIGAEVIPADATSIEDLENLFTKSEEILGGKIDFVLHAIGMSVNVRKKKDYTNLNHDWMQKTFDISAISFHKMCQVLYKGDHMAEWGSILGLSYIAAQRVFPDYGEMAESKALLESFARSFGYHFGEKNHVRVNTVSQSPTMTTAGKGIPGFTEFFGYGDNMSPLGNAPAEDCANFCATMFSDLTRYVTMQNLYHDGGFSNMGMNPKLLE
ncbi:SDR family oxidoreductase [Neolewinella aurantiaca]|uniref:Enoyl-[acyl-carrier-protein] reductase [NADH] n=1 Tax=Neolewinella aurantiaca TaxID=2602767 RepID=A0A5C7FK09_9BACT|nr:SDR family oxidoreductase [Neolewinella aurantiaca]TXF91678.1 SDR family oxidoreductase [Neolewinella aurantiaca]